METLMFVVDDHHGQFVPQVFAERFDINGVSDEDIQILRDGPNGDSAEYYWEAWDTVTMNGTVTDEEGVDWQIHNLDGGVFLSHPEHEWDEDDWV